MKKIHFEWDESEGAEFYRLYQKTPSGTDFVMAADNIVVPNFSLLMEGFEEGVHEFTVTANNQFVESGHSESVSVNFIIPQIPTNLHFSIV